jgi:hypothetical protein
MATTSSLDLNEAAFCWVDTTLNYWTETAASKSERELVPPCETVAEKLGNDHHQQQPSYQIPSVHLDTLLDVEGTLEPTAVPQETSSDPLLAPSTLPSLPKYAIVFGTYDAYNPPGATNAYRKIRGRRRNIAIEKLNDEVYAKLLDEFQRNPNIYGTNIPRTPSELVFVRKHVGGSKGGKHDMPAPLEHLSEFYLDMDGSTIYRRISNQERDHAVKKDINQKRTRNSDAISPFGGMEHAVSGEGTAAHASLHSLVNRKRQHLEEVSDRLDAQQVHDYTFLLKMSEEAMKVGVKTPFILQSFQDMLDCNWNLMVNGASKKPRPDTLGSTDASLQFPFTEPSPKENIPKNGCPWNAWNERTCAHAAADGKLDLLQYAYNHGCPWDENTCAKAAEFGHLHVLQWARSNGCPWDQRTCTLAAEKGHLHILQWTREHQCPWNAGTCEKAAEFGHLPILQWARTNGCEWNIRTCNEAAKNGHLHILQWARENGCEWNASTCASAAMNGHLDVLQWARTNGCNWDEWTCTRAAENGHLNVLQWARDNHCPWDEWTCVYAAENGHLDVLQWARTNGCLWYTETCTRAAKKGHLSVLQWARANGCDWDVWTCTFAAENGHFDVLQWARTNGCPWDEWTCTRAAENGHLDILQWARTNGCPWNSWTCTRAAENGHLHILQWARLNECPWDIMTCAFAAENGHLEILQWAHANGCPWNELTCTYAAENGHLDVLQWAQANGCKWDHRTCSRAAKYGHLEVLKWARSNGCLWDTKTPLYAAKSGHLHIVKWARENGCPDCYGYDTLLSESLSDDDDIDNDSLT